MLRMYVKTELSNSIFTVCAVNHNQSKLLERTFKAFNIDVKWHCNEDELKFAAFNHGTRTLYFVHNTAIHQTKHSKFILMLRGILMDYGSNEH